MKMIRFLTFTFVAGALAACAAEPLGETPSRFGVMELALEDFEVRREECIRIHGYDPDNPGDLGPNELAPTERAWANCAYDAVQTTLKLESTQPRLYDAVMAEHRTMTNKVEAGLMTRADREARMFQLRKDLREKEIARVRTDSRLDRIPQGTMELIRNSTFNATRF